MITKGELDFAVRRAQNNFDRWNDSVGLVNKFTSQYYELLGVIEDAVHCGAQTALNKLFEQKYFSICTLNNIMDAIGKGKHNSPAYKQLHALHCIDYADMPEELRQQIPHMVNEVLTEGASVGAATDAALRGVF